MHIQTHMLSGWCAANCLPCTPRQRLFAMVAASAADIDGIPIIFGHEAYLTYHHTFGHNVFTAASISAILAGFTLGHRFWSFLLYFVLFHLHLLMDYYGSGPDWHIHYIWPLPGLVLKNPNAWEFYSWQNLLTFFVLLLSTIWIAKTQRRTPLEAIMPKLDQELIRLLCGPEKNSS